MIRGGRLHIWPPSGATIERGADSINYTINDHLGSARVVADGVSHHEYGPYGNLRDGGTDAAVYAGRPLDPATGNYDYVARWYDPTLGRFITPDPDRQSVSPYSYADLNPINNMDPDGRVVVSFYFYSRYGTKIPDHYTGTKSLLPDIKMTNTVAKQSNAQVVLAQLEKPERIPNLEHVSVNHVMVDLHGEAGIVRVVNPYTDMPVQFTGSDFPQFLRGRLYQRLGGDISDQIRSINLLSCEGTCRPPGQLNSFAEEFARTARPYFPQLREVIASPYEFGVGGLRVEGQPDRMSFTIYPYSGRESIQQTMNPDRFFTGDFPDHFFEPPSLATVQSTTRMLPDPNVLAGRIPQTTTDAMRIWDFMRTHSHQLSEPTFRRFPVLPPPVEPVE